ncbi:MAG: tRNA (N6-threonylcarbamoyladenosine(37)-N6)-methyltransferase TrmO [Anaerovoracaceae bacterium]
MKPIAHIRTEFTEKFGIPRQSGLAETEGYIEFEPEYASPEAVRGLEDFSHIWLIWKFSESEGKGWSPTVRPPRLGGNERKGVFATRSPFRPNPIGLSCVKLESIEMRRNGPVLKIIGADLLDNTPIYDIKPYVPFVDSVPEASGGFAKEPPAKMKVVFEEKQASDGQENFSAPDTAMDEKTRKVVEQILSQNPVPAYQHDENRIYGMDYGGFSIKFKVGRRQITVVDIRRKCDKI